MIYEYKAEVHRIVDGDTVWLDVDLGFGVCATLDFRLAGINTPEVVGVDKAAGLAAKAELERLLSLGPLRIESRKSDKYGRWLAILFVALPDGRELNVNDTLATTGFATLYTGSGPKN